jgi:hypothetical protein
MCVVGNPVGKKKPFGRRNCGWEDNIEKGNTEISFGDVDWIHVAQDRDRWRTVVNTVVNFPFP